MPRWVVPILFITVLTLIVELYAFQVIKTLTKNKVVKWLWIAVNLAIFINLIYNVITTSRSTGQTPTFQLAFGLFVTFLLPKIVLLIVMFGEDIVRWVSYAFKNDFRNSVSSDKLLHGRRKFISQIALGLAAIPFSSFLYGIIKGKYNYKVLKYQLTFDDLPKAFDGFTITQISDIHSGSFTNKEKIKYGVDLINAQQSDLILFTGDIVNNKAEEMDDWIDMFKVLKAPYGKFSILGNHDYGDYTDWKTKDDKAKNFQDVKNIHPRIGFDLLLNEHQYLEKDGERIALVGVENWGKGFNQSGDLKKASTHIDKDDFKVLMSHDPSHWEYEIKTNDFNYQLTLSGHTHGLQFGIEIPGFIKWSPVKYIYKQWAGLYQEYGRYINVNRGFGYHVLPGRVGIWPEITVIELKKGVSNT